MKKILVAGMFFFWGQAFLENKVLEINNVHFNDFVQQVKAKIFEDGKYATCDVKEKKEKEELGEVKLVTKGDAKVDMVAVTELLKDEGYPIAPEKPAKAPKKPDAKKKAKS